SAADGTGRAWDTAGEIPVDGAILSFADAPDLVGQLAAHPNTARCVARRLFRFAFGHFEARGDRAMVSALEATSVATGGDVRALLEEVVAAEEFGTVRIDAEQE
ncbi:MAG: DUF1800 family protein, partial [Actinomycetota bacterium]